MPNGGKQYVNEKVQQYQQWAAEHPEANEYVKFAAYSGSAYAGYKGAAAMDAAWAARKAAKEKAKAVAREVAAQSRIAQNQAARKAANNAINERVAANASKPIPHKAPAAPSANAPKPAVPNANTPKPTPKPVANNPSSPKPVTPVPYVPAAVARSGADDFSGAVAARAAQQAVKKEADALARIGANHAARTVQNDAISVRSAARQAAKRIAEHRKANKNMKGGNLGYLDGVINGKKVDNKIWRSVSKKDILNEPKIFTATEATGSNGQTWLRNVDSEYRMLNNLAHELGAKPGHIYPQVRGNLTIVSEHPYCSSCSNVIQQFQTMFPNIKLTLINGVK